VEKPVNFMFLFTAVVMAVSIATPVYADGFNTVVEDTRIRLRLDYPPEVKAGSCFSITSDIVVLGDLAGLKVTIKIVQQGDSGGTVILDTKLLDELSVSAGFEHLRTLNLCLPSSSSNPFLEANITATYTAGDTSYKTKSVLFMSIVRSKTYSELSAELSSANAWINFLRDEIKRLEGEVRRLSDEVSSLKARLESAESMANDLRSKYQDLLGKHTELSAKYSELVSNYKSLKESFDSLNERYLSLLMDYGSLKGTYESLRASFETLQSSYEELRKDYGDVSRKLSSLQSLYSDLSSRHEELKKSYEESIKTIGSLQGALREREREAALLRANLEGAVSESSLAKSLAAAQAAGIALLGAYTYMRRRTKKSVETRRDEGKQGNPNPAPSEGEGPDNPGNPGSVDARIQRVLSGRRITIPSDIAERMGLRIGDAVSVSLLKDYLAVKRLEPAEGEDQHPPGPS